MGIGGTGVTTTAQILAMAAFLDGKRVAGLDQTGLSQKGGAVVSDVRILDDAGPRSCRASSATVDAYLGFDIVGASAAANLKTASADRTVAIVSTTNTPTGAMIGDPNAAFPDLNSSVQTINRVTVEVQNAFVDATGLCEYLFGDHMVANSLLLGVAWQRGLIPVSLPAIEEAFSLNGVAVEQNISAFVWGRAVVARPNLIEDERHTADHQVGESARVIVANAGIEAGLEVHDFVRSRVDDLIAYQNRSYATRYAEFVAKVSRAESSVSPGNGEITAAVARHLYKLMAYKDEYEVARLHLDPQERQRIVDEFGESAKVKVLLHPPALRTMGLKRKLEFGRWADPLLKVLRGLRFLRGTPFDVFGYAKVRRVERRLITEYRELVEMALPEVKNAPQTVLKLCEMPDLIRGYESVKIGNVREYRRRVDALVAELALRDDRAPMPAATTSEPALGPRSAQGGGG